MSQTVDEKHLCAKIVLNKIFLGRLQHYLIKIMDSTNMKTRKQPCTWIPSVKHVILLAVVLSTFSMLITFQKINSLLATKEARFLHIARIPEHIIMTHYAKDFFAMEEHFKSNAIKTIFEYTDAWKKKRLGMKQVYRQRKLDVSIDSLPPGVWYLNDIECMESINRVEPELVVHFLNETVGKFRADICRIAALYEKGGYYFDIDMEVVRPIVDVSPETTFISVTSPALDGKTFFQSFMAAAPQHPMLRLNLDLFLKHYRSIASTGEGIFKTLIGPEALRASYLQFYSKDESKFWPSDMSLSEDHLDKTYPRLYRRGDQYDCRWIVRNATQDVIYFYSRFVGSGKLCPK